MRKYTRGDSPGSFAYGSGHVAGAFAPATSYLNKDYQLDFDDIIVLSEDSGLAAESGVIIFTLRNPLEPRDLAHLQTVNEESMCWFSSKRLKDNLPDEIAPHAVWKEPQMSVHRPNKFQLAVLERWECINGSTVGLGSYLILYDNEEKINYLHWESPLG